MLIIAIVICTNAWDKKQITAENRIVSVKVIESPLNCQDIGKRYGTFKFQFNGKLFEKRVTQQVCKTLFGKKMVNMFTNRQKTKLLFFKEYEESNEFFSGILLGVFGVFIAYKGWKS